MSRMRIGNAPVSWGIFEHEEPWSDKPAFDQVLAEMRAAGYSGTELGPYGYYPTQPDALHPALSRHGLGLASAFVPVDLTNPSAESALAEALEVGKLLAAMGSHELVLADATHEERLAVAGFATSANSLTERQWAQVARTVEQIARAVAGLGLRTVFHHHTGTYVETPEEVDRFCQLTDPAIVGLCLDTGHYIYGGGDPTDAVRQYGERIRYVHLKDVWPEKLATVRASRMPMDAAWALGVFSPLGEGALDLPGFVEALRAVGYQGWLVVEQDVVVGKGGAIEPTPFESARLSREYLAASCGL